MGFELRIKSIAYQDIDDAILWYEKKLPGLGKRFFLHVLSCLRKIEDQPESFSYLLKPVRKCHVKKFPFKIIYVVEENLIFVLGVYSIRRSKSFERKRTGKHS